MDLKNKREQSLSGISSRFVLFFLIILGISIQLLAQDVTDSSVATIEEEQDYAFAIGLYRDSLFQLAGRQFEAFVNKYPHSIKRQDADFLRVECFFHSSQFQNAAAKYGEFVQRYPTSRYLPEAYLKLGQAYLNLKKNREAITAFKTVIDKWGENERAGEAAYWIGEAYLRSEDTQNAEKYFTLSYENYSQNRLRDYALYSIAWTLQKRTEYAKASDWYGKLIVEFPHSSLAPAARVRIGECFYYAKEYKRSIDELKKSRTDIHDEEELGNADYLIAEAFYKLGDNVGAQSQYKKFLEKHPQHKLAPEVTYALGWSYLNQKNYSGAIQIFNSLSERSDELGQLALYRRAAAEKLAGEKDKSLITLNNVILRDPMGEFADNALFDIGIIFFEEGNIDKAKLYFQRITTEYPNGDMFSGGCKMLGECYISEGGYKEAQLWFEKALAKPDAPFDVKVGAAFQAAFSVFKQRKYKEAAARFSSFIQQYPDHSKTGEAKYYQAEAEYRLGSFDLSSRLYRESADAANSVKKEESLYGLAWSFYKQAKFQQAIESFETLILAFPKGKFVLDARLRIGDSYFFLKEFKKAVNIYRAVTRMYPESLSIDYAYFQIGQSYFKDGDNNGAFKAFEGLIKILPKSPYADDAQFALGWINFQQKEYGEAIKEFQKLLKTYPNSELLPRAYYSLGDSYYNLRQFVASEKTYREVLKQFPKSNYVADAITGIQYCLIAQGKENEAVDVIDDFINSNPDVTIGEELLLKKGELLYHQNKYTEAVRVYRKYSEQYPRSKNLAQAQYFIAKCYRAQGNPDEAVLAFERAADIPNASEKIVGESIFEAAEILDSQNKSEKAIRLLQRLQEKVKDREIVAEAKVRTGQSFQLLGNMKEAGAQFDQVSKNFGDLSIADEAKIARARIHFQLGEYDKVKAIAEKIATTHKDELGAEAQYLVGASLAGKKEWTNVITALLRVKYVFPSYERWVGRAYLGLGDAYEQIKEMKLARESYQAALKLKTDKSVIEEAQHRLKRMEQ